MKRKIIYVLSFLIIVLTIVLCLPPKDEEILENTRQIKKQNILAIMVETGKKTQVYKEYTSDSWPTDGYKFNSELSGCKNGGELSWDSDKKIVNLVGNSEDKCYAYFDALNSDVMINISNNPTTYGKLGSLTCDNSTTLYNQQYNRIEISAMSSDHITCSLNYTDSTSKTNLAKYIIGLSGTTQGTGQVVNEKGYRYEGKNPNNYVWFNNEYWRIIGVFDNTSHGQSGKNLVKIIREELLSGLAFDKNNSSNWTTSSLRSLLNENYYNATNGTESGYCYNYSNVITNNCNYTKIGIQDKYRKMIANVTWYLGGHTTYNVTTDALYGYERGSNVVSPAPTSTTGYIGLMYPSDYGYSALASSCARTTNVSSYRSNNCSGSSWLYGKGIEWTITPGGTANYVYYIDNYGFVDRYYAIYGNGIRPVVYLDSTVYKVSGTGSIDSPYIIGM